MEKPKSMEPFLENEKKELPIGKYNIVVEFIKRNGENCSISLDFSISLVEGETEEDLRKKAVGEASALGLHNFGMDTYVKHFPGGHPVKFTLKHISGKEIEFTQTFNGSGYPINKE